MLGPLCIVQRVQLFSSQKNDRLVVGGGGDSDQVNSVNNCTDNS